jgi:cold shock protein
VYPKHRMKQRKRIGVVRGTVIKWFSQEKGYGFISPDEGEEEIFHSTHYVGEGIRSLKEGERVSYETTGSARGVRKRKEAKNVRRVE